VKDNFSGIVRAIFFLTEKALFIMTKMTSHNYRKPKLMVVYSKLKFVWLCVVLDQLSEEVVLLHKKQLCDVQ
jgi:hypothetical protein